MLTTRSEPTLDMGQGMKRDTASATIMVVDDTPANLRYLQAIFLQSNYRVVAFPTGESALRAARKNPPDIILLDILMPEMDGFEVCRRLKADPVLRRIPVLFISALTDQEEKGQAFAAGGVDYVTKPFADQEVLMRVDTHLRLYRFTQSLEQMVAERTAQLTEANEALRQEVETRRQAEERLRTNQVMLQSIFDGIPEPLLLVERDLRLKLHNRAAAVYLQAAGVAFASGRRLCDGRHDAGPDSCGLCSLATAMVKGERGLERKGMAAPERIEQVLLYPLDSDSQSPGEVIVRIADVTEARRLEQEMAQADKLIALGTLVAGVAHEINNPNHVITLNASILQDVWRNIAPIVECYYQEQGDFQVDRLSYGQLKEDISGLIGGIESSAGRIQRIVAILKDYSAKNDSLTLGPTEVNQTLENAVLLLAYKIKKATSRFQIAYGQGLPLLNADRQKLEQVFVNLIANALESLPSTDMGVFVETAHEKRRRRIVVTVRDEGGGISPHVVGRIMDPFFTTKRAAGGTGLGLSIVQQFVSLHHGTIEVDSEEGRGTTFRVILPLDGQKNRLQPPRVRTTTTGGCR